MKITEEQKKILDKYNVNYNYNNVEDFLTELFAIMNDYIDENDNPKKEYKELEKVYYEIYNQNEHLK